MPSFEESILSAIAFGYTTRNLLSRNLGISYSSLIRILNKLESEDKIIKYEDRKSECYGLKISERWRLYSFPHSKIVIDRRDPYLISTDDIKPTYIFDGTEIFKTDSDFFDGTILYTKMNGDFNEISKFIESKIEMLSYLPIALFFENTSLSIDQLDDFKFYYINNLPIYFITEKDELIEYKMPHQCQFQVYENEVVNQILRILMESQNLMSTSEIAEILSMDKETIRKKLYILLNKDKIERVQSGYCVELQWRARQTNL